MEQDYTQEEIDAILASIDIDDAQIARDTAYAKISEAKKGHLVSRATRDKISQANSGRESKKKGVASGIIADSCFKKGHKPANTGKAVSEITKDKIREARKLQIMGPVSNDTRRKMSEKQKGISTGLGQYIYSTPDGEFENRIDMIKHYEGRYTLPSLNGMIKNNRHGFSRRLKDV